MTWKSATDESPENGEVVEVITKDGEKYEVRYALGYWFTISDPPMSLPKPEKWRLKL